MVDDVIFRKSLSQLQFFRLQHPQVNVGDGVLFAVLHQDRRDHAEAVFCRDGRQRLIRRLPVSCPIIFNKEDTDQTEMPCRCRDRVQRFGDFLTGSRLIEFRDEDRNQCIAVGSVDGLQRFFESLDR